MANATTQRSGRTALKATLAASAAGLLALSLPLAPAQAAPKKVDPVGNWTLTGLQIGDAPVVPCPTPTTAFSERWYCEANATLRLNKNGTYRDNIPIIQTNRGTWFTNGKNIIVFDDADDDGADARAYKMAIKGKTMKISLRSSGRGPNEATLELHMIFKKK
jgi:hypothetical protein